MKIAFGALLAFKLCFSLGVQAAFVSPKLGQADTHKLKKTSFFLQAGNEDSHSSIKSNLMENPTIQMWGPPDQLKENTTRHTSTRLQCGVTEQVGANTDKYENCPADCPYFAQNRMDNDFCTFLCTAGTECGKWNPKKPIPDTTKGSSTCRGPVVAFCKEPMLDGTDSCSVCQWGFVLGSDKQCYFEYWNTLWTCVVIIVIILVVLIVWVVDIACRETTNEESVMQAEAWRSRSKLICREEGQHSTYPLTTNLCTQDVAGPGMLLHFRFQLFFICWPLCCGLIWTFIACFHHELFVLGTRKFGTPRHNCILVFWGYETQQRLMWTKVLFLAIVYVGSFISFLLFSVAQLRKYQRIDAKEKTMKDFALRLIGLPAVSGEHKTFEKDLKSMIERCTSLQGQVIGVSVAWDFSSADNQDAIAIASNKVIFRRELEYHLESKNKRKPTKAEVQKALDDEAKKTENAMDDKPGRMPEKLYNMERQIICPLEELENRKTIEEEDKDIKKLVQSINSSNCAYVVFNTEAARDQALNHQKEGGKLEFKEEEKEKYGCGKDSEPLEFVKVINEPANINWHNFGDNSQKAMLKRFFYGFCTVYLPALAIWFFCFYVPYAMAIYNFNYDNGAELPGYYSIVFTIVVCGGNATMYFVCDLCCDIIGFRYKDTKQIVYMIMYLTACMINVFLDMVVTYKVALKVMVGMDFRTYTGERLAHIDEFTEQFETYAMQRSLGENVFSYAWPSTFFICFVIEPLPTVIVPYWLGRHLIRTHKEVRGTCAEAYLAAFEFDLGRYSDILLNVFLGILIFYFPGGYIWSLFFAMAFSHAYIYMYDHWKVLSCIPTIRLVSSEVEWWAHVVMCGMCGIILSCLVFKGNCEPYMGYCMGDVTLVGFCTIAGVAHFIVHFLLLLYLVPALGLDLPDDQEGMTYKAVAEQESRSWFSSNPVHCLRSMYVHEDKIPCRLVAYGKEHLLEVNKEIGCHFQTEMADAENYDIRKSFVRMKEQASAKLTKTFSHVKSESPADGDDKAEKAEEAPKK